MRPTGTGARRHGGGRRTTPDDTEYVKEVERQRQIQGTSKGILNHWDKLLQKCAIYRATVKKLHIYRERLYMVSRKVKIIHIYIQGLHRFAVLIAVFHVSLGCFRTSEA